MTPAQLVARALYLAHCRCTVTALEYAVRLGVPRADVLAGLVEVLGGAAAVMGEGEAGR